MSATENIRNVVLLGHPSGGKTSIAEAMLFKAGLTSRLGSVEDKTSICDYYEEERERGHSISSAVVHLEHDGRQINIIDTPGYPDFIGASIMAIPAGDAALLVMSASAGVDTNTRRLYNLLEQAHIPRFIIINKIDAGQIDIQALLRLIQDAFGPQCRCVNIPTTDGQAVVDCLAAQASPGHQTAIDLEKAHTDLIERVVETDDSMMESYLAGESLPAERLAQALVKAVAGCTLVPIVFTSAKKLVGIQELLDLIVRLVPSAAARTVEMIDGPELQADPSGPLAGYVFRIGYDPKSNMKYTTIRLFSGTIRPDMTIVRNDQKKGFRPGHILISQGPENQEVEQGIAGQIITLARAEELKLGDLIHEGNISGRFPIPPLPEPMYALALEPAARGDEQKISGALERLCEEDPCLKAVRDTQTKELVLYGLGELHLRVMLERMERRFKLAVNTKEPKIPYRETITAKAEGHYRHKKQTGGAGQFGEVFLRVEPAPRNSQPPLQFSWDIFGGAIPSQFEPAVLKGINDVMERGVVAGFPMQDIKVSVYDGKHHPVDSKEVAFRTAAKGAFIDAVQKAKPVLLEPIVNIEVTVPAENMGDITGDLAGKRGRVLGQEVLPGGYIVIKAQVPLAEVSQYSSQLKSVTGGRGSYTMSFSHYEPVPSNIQAQIVARYAKERQQEEED
ncbi:MAG: elongation factor G [Sedimentisphaerales bacterium]|nr:elongation factor G [Sedimentisphaerales bacterium]